MNNPIFFATAAAAAFLLSFPATQAADLPAVASKIKAITVYGDRAVVTRTAETNLAAGTREIRFERLPATLLEQSLQVSGSGTANATILDVTASQTFVEVTPDARSKALEDELKTLGKQIRALVDRRATLDQQREFVKTMLAAAMSVPAPAPGATPASRLSTDEMKKLYDYSDETTGKIVAEAQALTDQQEALEARRTAVNNQIAGLRGPGALSVKTVVVRVAAAQNGNLQLNLSYTVPNASWSPAYDARVHTANRTVALSYFGVVRQSTGEDWENVALTLSTAQPSQGGSAPALPLWVVDVARPQPAGSPGVSSMQTRGNMTEAAAWSTGQTFYSTDNSTHFAAVRGPAEVPAEFSQAEVETGTTSATFKIAAPVSLPSNNNSQRVAITTLDLKSELRYESTPKMREAAFLAAPAVNSSAYPLLAGPLNTFLDDSYVATGRMTAAMPSEPFDLALGVDEGIGIKRKVLNRFAEDVGLSNKTKRVTYEILITVTNFKSTEEKVRFREAIPRSRDEKIIVKQITPQEKDIGTPSNIREVIREIDGKLTWRLTLKPGEKRDVPLKFSVEYPSDVSITGLE